MTDPTWPTTPSNAVEATDALFTLYTERGASHYDETVTQTEHALQTAALATSERADDTLVVAALLHDIGHLLVDEHDRRAGFLDHDEQHEKIGAAMLGRWFPPAVAGPVALHVPAKRYLVATDPAYADSLSPASFASLSMQGGPFDQAAADAFIRHRHAEPACRLRRWDDRAKVTGLPTPPLEHYRPLVESLITFPRSDR